MAIPEPERGLVVHFDYLWARERDQGREEARYPRPCAIVLAQRRERDGVLIVTLAPITHSEPDAQTAAIEIPPRVKAHLGLDEARSWVIVDEVNETGWPGFDLRPNARGDYAYGFVPPRLYDRIRAGIVEAWQKKRLRLVRRED